MVSPTSTAGSLGGWLDAGAIFALVAVLGATRAFEMPAQQALLAGVVQPADFPRATAMSASAHQLATICGPAAGGLQVEVLTELVGTVDAETGMAVAFRRPSLGFVFQVGWGWGGEDCRHHL